MVVNQKPTIIILIGAPCSGKTTWALKHLRFIDNAVVIQREGLFESIRGHRYIADDYKELALTMIEVGIAKALSLGMNVIYDGCNSSVHSISHILKLFSSTANIVYKIFDVTEDTILEYNNKKHGATGIHVSQREIDAHLWSIDNIRYCLDELKIKPYICQGGQDFLNF